MTYLLDTNVWVVFLRNPHSPVVSRRRAPCFRMMTSSLRFSKKAR